MAGNSVIGALRVVLGLDSAQFEEGLKKSQGSLAGFSKLAQGAGLAVGAALATAAVAMGAAVKETIDQIDEMSKASQKFGVPIDQLSRLKHAADLSDVSLDQLGAGLKKLSAGMMDSAAGGTGPAADALATLGIKATDADGKLRPLSDVVADVAGKFGGMQDGAGKTAIAMDLFGKSGTDLIPLLNSGADGLAEMARESDELGLTLDQKTGTAAENFNDNLSRLHMVAGGMITQVTAGLLPGLEALSENLVGAAKDTALMDAVTGTLDFTLKALVSTGVIVAAVFKATYATITGAAHAVMQVTRGDFKGAVDTLNQKVFDVGQVAEQVKQVWAATGSGLKARAPALAEGVAAPIVQSGAKMKAAADKAAKDAERAREQLKDAAQRVLDGLLTEDERYAQHYAESLRALKDARDADLISVKQYLDALERLEIERQGRMLKLLDLPKSVDFEHDYNKEVVDPLKAANDDIKDSLDEVVDSFGRLFSAIRNKDWGGALSGIAGAIKGLGSNLGAGLSSVTGFLGRAGTGMAAGQAMGLGTGNTAADLALSLGGTVAGGMIASSALGGTIAAGIANGVIGLGGSAALASSMGVMLSSAAVLGPIAAVAALAIGTLLKSKPSNNAAIADINGSAFSLSGNKRTDETSQAASAAAQAVIQGQELLKQAGATLATTVKQIDIGTRDMTHVLLSSGQEIRTAVGDPAAAAEAGLKAVLASATFADEAAQKLVQSMLAAGKGFDDIVAGLQGFAAAQQFQKGIADAILQLTDPKAFDVAQLQKAQADRRAQLQAAVAAGYLTAAQFDALNVQLAKLEGLELDEVLKKYAVAVEDASAALDDQAQAAADAVAQAQSDLREAYDREVEALQQREAQYRDITAGLRAFRESLNRSLVGALTPGQQLAQAQATFRRVLGLARGGDASAAAQLQDVSQAYLDAQAKAATSQRDNTRAALEVRTGLAEVEGAFTAQADATAAQIQALHDQVAALIQLDQGMLTVAQAVDNLTAALQAQADLTQQLSAQSAAAATAAVAAGEMVDASAGASADVAGQLAEIKTSLDAGLYAVARNTAAIAALQRKWDLDGQPAVRDVEAA